MPLEAPVTSTVLPFNCIVRSRVRQAGRAAPSIRLGARIATGAHMFLGLCPALRQGCGREFLRVRLTWIKECAATQQYDAAFAQGDGQWSAGLSTIERPALRR